MLCPKLVPLLNLEEFDRLTDIQQTIYLQRYREQVSPKFEEWRNPHRIKAAYGGRGAGAKSRSAGNLLIQFGENPRYFGESIRVLCVRDVQKSIKESSWLLLSDTIDRLRYTGWSVQNDKITNPKNGSLFVFNALSEMTADQLKSYESFDILFAEEADPIKRDPWISILATFKKMTSEIWMLFNRNLNLDPCYEMFCMNPDPSWSILSCRPGEEDNPWWWETNQQAEWDRLKAQDPDEALHVFEGLPRVQGDKAIFSRVRVEAMKDRAFEDVGEVEIGCDVARFGKDWTHAYKRKGLRVIQHESRHGYDTNSIVGMLWDMAERNPKIPIKVDVGFNPGVCDGLRDIGANIIEVGFGEVAQDEERYVNTATEMLFELPVDMMSIPKEFMTTTLFEDLTERYFVYDRADRKRIESKDGTTTTEVGETKSNFKGRHGGRSPDEGDALCLTFLSRQGWHLI